MKKMTWIVTTMMCLTMVCVSCKKDKAVESGDSTQKTETVAVQKPAKKVSFAKKVYVDESGFITDIYFYDDEFLVESFLCASYSYDKKTNEITITGLNIEGELVYTYDPETDTIISDDGFKRTYGRLCTDEEMESLKDLKEEFFEE